MVLVHKRKAYIPTNIKFYEPYFSSLVNVSAPISIQMYGEMGEVVKRYLNLGSITSKNAAVT
jgi:hypothetical protein